MLMGLLEHSDTFAGHEVASVCACVYASACMLMYETHSHMGPNSHMGPPTYPRPHTQTHPHPHKTSVKAHLPARIGRHQICTTPKACSATRAHAHTYYSFASSARTHLQQVVVA